MRRQLIVLRGDIVPIVPGRFLGFHHPNGEVVSLITVPFNQKTKHCYPSRSISGDRTQRGCLVQVILVDKCGIRHALMSRQARTTQVMGVRSTRCLISLKVNRQTTPALITVRWLFCYLLMMHGLSI